MRYRRMNVARVIENVQARVKRGGGSMTAERHYYRIHLGKRTTNLRLSHLFRDTKKVKNPQQHDLHI